MTSERQADTTFEETLREQADYFGMEVDALREVFRRFLALPYEDAKAMDPFERAACIGIYRITKLKSACRMTRKSRERWRTRALDAGWKGEDDDA